MLESCVACSVRPKAQWSSKPQEPVTKPKNQTMIEFQKFTDLLEAVAGKPVQAKVGTEDSRN